MPISLPEAPPAGVVRAGKWALLLAVAGFELHVLSLIPQLHQNEQYRRHYIDGTSGCYFPDSYRRAVLTEPRRDAQIVMAGIEVRRACVYLPYGWYPVGEGRAMSFGPRSLLTLPMPLGSRRILLDLTTGRDVSYPMIFAIRQGPRLLYRQSMKPGEARTVAIDPDPAMAPNGIVELTMDRRYAVPPDWPVSAKQSRHMRIQLTRIRFEPGGASPGSP